MGIAQRVTGVKNEEIKGMLQIITHEGFGERTILKDKADVFMKPHPSTISPDDFHLVQAKVSYEEYTTAFMTKPSDKDWRPARQLEIIQNHPHSDLFDCSDN